MYYVAAICLIVEYVLFWLLDTPAVSLAQEIAAWVVLAVGIVLIALPISVLRRKGQVREGKGYVATKKLVDTGIYAVVRHPQYLGWLLMYPALYLFNPHWQLGVWAVLGVVCLGVIARQEDKRLIEKFGKPYEKYMRTVPAMNPLAGVIRLLRRR